MKPIPWVFKPPKKVEGVQRMFPYPGTYHCNLSATVKPGEDMQLIRNGIDKILIVAHSGKTKHKETVFAERPIKVTEENLYDFYEIKIVKSTGKFEPNVEDNYKFTNRKLELIEEKK